MTDDTHQIRNAALGGLLVCCLALLCGCDCKPVKEPTVAPVEHTVVVLPEAAEKRMADLESQAGQQKADTAAIDGRLTAIESALKSGANVSSPAVIELQEKARASQLKFADIDKLLAEDKKMDLDYFKNVFTLLDRVRDCEKAANGMMDHVSDFMNMLKKQQADINLLKSFAPVVPPKPNKPCPGGKK